MKNNGKEGFKNTFDTTSYNEDDMFNSMNEALKDIEGESFMTSGTINGKSITFQGFIDPVTRDVRSMWPIGS